MIGTSPVLDRQRRERTSGPRLVDRVKAPKPSPGRRVKQKAAVTPATVTPASYETLTHKTPEAALFARLKKTSTKKGSPGVVHDVSPTMGAVTVAKMAAAVRKAEKAEEERLKRDKDHKAKVDGMGGRMGRNIPFARPHL